MSNWIDTLKDNIYLSTRSTLNMLGYENDIVVIYSNEDILSPKKEYCVVSIISIKEVGMPDKSDNTLRATNSDKIDFVSSYIIDVQYSFIGKVSSLFATEMHHSLTGNQLCVLEYASNNLGILNKTQLRNSPQKWDTRWVDGWNFNTNLTYSLHTEHTFNWINKVIIEGDGSRTVVEYIEI